MQIKRSISVAVAAAALAAPATAAAQQFAPSAGSAPTAHNRPVLPHGAPAATATFIDPTAQIDSPQDVRFGSRTYVAPFAKLLAGDDDSDDDVAGSQSASIRIGSESNVQDNVRIEAGDDDGVVIGDRVILAHGSSVEGLARIGVDGHDVEANNDGKPETFVSFNAQVDGAIIEKNAQVSALARVAPGIRLKSGWVVKPGKNIAAKADLLNPDKVRPLSEADVEFAEAVVDVNTQLAREYTHLYHDDHANVRGINFDPGHTSFNHGRNLPETGATVPADPHAEGDEEYCDGTPARDPDFRNRIIGAVCLEDSRAELGDKLGDEVSLRADEGEPFSVGHIHSMGDNATFHALEHADIEVGDNVSYGDGAIVHGGDRTPEGPNGPRFPTRVEDDVTLQDLSVTFKSQIGEGATIGYKSAVIDSVIAPHDVVEDRTIVLAGDKIKVEW